MRTSNTSWQPSVDDANVVEGCTWCDALVANAVEGCITCGDDFKKAEDWTHKHKRFRIHLMFLCSLYWLLLVTCSINFARKKK